MLWDQILVLPIDGIESGPVVTARQYEDKPEWGLVIAVGPGRYTENGTLIEPGIEPGDVVVYGQYSTTKVRSHGTDYFFIRADDVMSVYYEPSFD